MSELRASPAAEFVGDVGEDRIVLSGILIAANHAAWDIAFEQVEAHDRSDNDANELREYRNEELAQCALVRDIFRYPARNRVLDRSWLTATVTALARQMYDRSIFVAMPILADALEEAGCDDAEVLAHCRGPGPHVRGCWILDSILGKQ